MTMQYYGKIEQTKEQELGISPLGMLLVMFCTLISLSLFLNPESEAFDFRIGSIIALSIAFGFGAGLRRHDDNGDLGRKLLYALVGVSIVSITSMALNLSVFSVERSIGSGITLYLVLGTPVVFEELLFRGGIFLGVKRLSGTIVAIIVQAVLFATYHAFVSFDINYFMLLFLGGIVLALIFIITKDLLTSMLAHAIINLRPYLFEMLITPASLAVIGIVVIFYMIKLRRG